MTGTLVNFERKAAAKVATTTRPSASLKRCFEELAFREGPDLVNVIAWERLSDVLAPLIREDVRLVDH